MNQVIIIPARHASTRFPGKPLAMLCGKPVVQHVYEQAAAVCETFVATVNSRIADAVRDFGGNVVMIAGNNDDSTSRVAEAVKILESEGRTFDLVANVEGGEPLLSADELKMLFSLLDEPEADISTLACPFADESEADVADSVKVVLDNRSMAMYFSRALVPHPFRYAPFGTFLKHVGVYAYRRPLLDVLPGLPPSVADTTEWLGQLRWLAAGYRIRVGRLAAHTAALDTPADLTAVEIILLKRQLLRK